MDLASLERNRSILATNRPFPVPPVPSVVNLLNLSRRNRQVAIQPDFESGPLVEHEVVT